MSYFYLCWSLMDYLYLTSLFDVEYWEQEIMTSNKGWADMEVPSESFHRSSWDSRTCYARRAFNRGLTDDCVGHPLSEPFVSSPPDPSVTFGPDTSLSALLWSAGFLGPNIGYHFCSRDLWLLEILAPCGSLGNSLFIGAIFSTHK